MSTKAPLRLILLLLAAAGLGGCASAPAPSGAEHAFGELRFGGARAAPMLRPRLTTEASVLPVTLKSADERVETWLGREGFTLERQAEPAGVRLVATRMGAPALLDGDAACQLEALHRPDISSTNLVVRLQPEPGGVMVQSEARFVEVDTRLIAGALTRQTCRSLGVLEGEVRRAALGG